jgi:lipoprotein signal peptidase
MLTKTRSLALIALVGFFLCTDQTLKWLATHSWSRPLLLNHFIGWDPFLNPGVAFGLPIPNILILMLTLPIILFLTYLLQKKLCSTKTTALELLATACLLCGALSNAVDRILYSYTIDYFRVFISIFNVADVLIVLGFVIYLLTAKEKKNESELF